MQCWRYPQAYTEVRQHNDYQCTFTTLGCTNSLELFLMYNNMYPETKIIKPLLLQHSVYQHHKCMMLPWAINDHVNHPSLLLPIYVYVLHSLWQAWIVWLLLLVIIYKKTKCSNHKVNGLHTKNNKISGLWMNDRNQSVIKFIKACVPAGLIHTAHCQLTTAATKPFWHTCVDLDSPFGYSLWVLVMCSNTVVALP